MCVSYTHALPPECKHKHTAPETSTRKNMKVKNEKLDMMNSHPWTVDTLQIMKLWEPYVAGWIRRVNGVSYRPLLFFFNVGSDLLAL